MSRDLKPFCPVNARFFEDLKLSGRKPRTPETYVRAVRKFTEFLGHPPDQATADQLRKYLIFLADSKKWAGSTSTKNRRHRLKTLARSHPSRQRRERSTRAAAPFNLLRTSFLLGPCITTRSGSFPSKDATITLVAVCLLHEHLHGALAHDWRTLDLPF